MDGVCGAKDQAEERMGTVHLQSGINEKADLGPAQAMGGRAETSKRHNYADGSAGLQHLCWQDAPSQSTRAALPVTIPSSSPSAPSLHESRRLGLNQEWQEPCILLQTQMSDAQSRHQQAQMQNVDLQTNARLPDPSSNIYQQIASTLQQLHVLRQRSIRRGERQPLGISERTMNELMMLLIATHGTAVTQPNDKILRRAYRGRAPSLTERGLKIEHQPQISDRQCRHVGSTTAAGTQLSPAHLSSEQAHSIYLPSDDPDPAHRQEIIVDETGRHVFSSTRTKGGAWRKRPHAAGTGSDCSGYESGEDSNSTQSPSMRKKKDCKRRSGASRRHSDKLESTDSSDISIGPYKPRT